MFVPKFTSEFGVSMSGIAVAILQQTEFHLLETPAARAELEENPCHIYMICRRPKILFDVSSINISKEEISGTFLVQDEHVQRPFPFVAENRLAKDNLTFHCPYPHTVITLFNEHGARVQQCNAAVLAGECEGDQMSEQLALEVLYVGQAYGEDGSRTATDRLPEHKTLQRILAEALARSPHMDIWIILWSFTSRLITAIDGRWNQYGTSQEEDDLHVQHVLSNPVTVQQEINFTEAALIKYFQPPYNKTFRNTFPSPAHKTYGECYDLDINSVIVDLDIEYATFPCGAEQSEEICTTLSFTISIQHLNDAACSNG